MRDEKVGNYKPIRLAPLYDVVSAIYYPDLNTGWHADRARRPIG
jgi:hypothetical protein